MLRAIPSSEISVVIQGPLFRDHADGDLALRCVRSVREHLPDAEIIISTWEGEDASGLDIEHVVKSADPGAIRGSNLLRQLVSTGVGIAVASRPYVLKLRCDLALNSAAIATISSIENVPQMRRFSPGVHPYRITTTNLFVRDPTGCGALFHPSDIVMFGSFYSMRNFWHEPPIGMQFDPDACSPEQWLMHRYMGLLTLLAPATNFAPWHVGFSERALAANFHVLDWHQSGVVFPARLAAGDNNVYSASSFATIGRRMLEGTYRPPYLRSLKGLLRSRWVPIKHAIQVAILKLFPRGLKDAIKRQLSRRRMGQS
jgi:hypothetical protein